MLVTYPNFCQCGISSKVWYYLRTCHITEALFLRFNCDTKMYILLKHQSYSNETDTTMELPNEVVVVM